MTGMSQWDHLAHLAVAYGLGALTFSAAWGIVLGFSPRRRGRHEAQPELEPSATGVLHAITQPVQPPLPRRDSAGRWPLIESHDWSRIDEDGWWT